MATAPDIDAPANPLDAFRAEARAWIAANFPPALKGKDNAMSAIEGPHENSPEEAAWQQAMGDKGWGVPTWPREYGGGGLSRAEARILQEEMQRAGAWNPIGGMGVMMFGPTLLEYGSEEQKRAHIPAIAKGLVRWCQGYSEPGAGSDLASLQTFAEDHGDHYVVNGQKTWTSGGQWADKCFMLVRTDKTKKHEGITFLLVDMDTPGVEVKPIRLISGSSPFCETFFTDVKVPKANRVGQEGEGWTIGKRLLQHERSSLSGGGSAAGRMFAGASLGQIAKKHVGVDAEGRIADADLRGRIARHEMDLRSFMLTLRRTALEAKSNQGPSAATSIMKNVGARIMQERSELLIEIRGLAGLGWDGDGFEEDAIKDVRSWLFGKAVSIYGGSTEIQNNVIAKRILGMLDHQQLLPLPFGGEGRGEGESAGGMPLSPTLSPQAERGSFMAILTEEQTMLRDMAREWADNEAPVTAFRKMRDAAPAAGYDAEMWRAQAEMGWAGILVPEAQGGAGMGYVSLGLVLEQLGRNLVATPLAATAAATSAILMGGSEAQKAEWLPRIAAGALVATLAIDEGPRFDPSKIATKVEGGKLSGVKAFVPEGDSAQLFVVAATDGLYLVSGDAGVTRSPRHLTDARSHAQVTFDRAPAEALGGGAELIAQVADRAAAASAAEMLGMAESAFAQTNDYLKTRVQFGQVLASFQALQHRMAKMFTELELCRSAVEGALEAIDSGRANVAQEASLAKAVANETLHLVSREMIQLHGGIGMTDEHDAGFYLKRARVLEAQWGNAAWHRDRFARLNGY